MAFPKTDSVKTSGLTIQPESDYYQKLVDGYQKHVFEVKMTNRHLTVRITV